MTTRTSSRPAEKARRPGLVRWIRMHQVTAAAVAGLLLVGSVVVAAVALQQNAVVTPEAATPVIFDTGTDYVSINAAGFATVTLGASKTSATLDITGVPGAASLGISNVMKLKNNVAHAWSVTVARSVALPAAITSFIVTFDDGTTQTAWNVVSSSSVTFTLPASATANISVAPAIADGTTLGAVGAGFTMQFTIA